MAQVLLDNPLNLVKVFYLTIFSSFYFTITQQKGFSLELIHRNSPKSPLYPGNVSNSQRFNLLLELSKKRAYKMEKLSVFNRNATNITSKIVRFGLSQDDLSYYVKIHLGTPGIPLFLLVDTGSSLTWTQCEPVSHRFHQNPPIFSHHSSRTYHPVSCHHPFCRSYTPDMFRCDSDDRCTYTDQYADNASTTGVAAMDVMRTHDGNQIIVYFGCSYENYGFNFGPSGRSGGIMGLNLSPISVLRQWSNLTHGRFSYCLVPPQENERSTTLLRFGDAIPIHGRNFQTIRVAPPGRSNHYYVNLLDISVGSRAMRFPRHMFASTRSGTGGCIMDSGTPLTFIITQAYDRLVSEFQSYFDHHRLVRYHPDAMSTMLCYRYQHEARLQDYPSLTYHFEGAHFTVQPRYLYTILHDLGVFCLNLAPDPRRSQIGALHQANTRFVYEADPHHPRIHFASENCIHDRI